MATNKSLEVQKEKLYYVLLSRREGYTNTDHILKDLRNDFGIDGNALSRAHGHQSFQNFLESASMREYCRIVEEPRATTVYYGIGKNRTQHLERERQISIPYEQLKEAEKKQNGTMTSDPNGLKPRRQCGFLQQKDSERIPCDPFQDFCKEFEKLRVDGEKKPTSKFTEINGHKFVIKHIRLSDGVKIAQCVQYKPKEKTSCQVWAQLNPTTMEFIRFEKANSRGKNTNVEHTH
ncbi:hypothetical protein Ddc_13368 [Ditylenchus destructor]|nr:hypothetical protein Ddc_13368 [Ditylenchus destructor]